MSEYYGLLGLLLKLREQVFLTQDEFSGHLSLKNRELFATLCEDLDELDEELAEAICELLDEMKAEVER